MEWTPLEGEADQEVALGDVAGQRRAALHGADREAGEVEVAGGVHARHLGGLAADEGGARLGAARGDAFDDGGGGVDVEPAGGVVVEEEERVGALADQIVDAHGDEVDADGADRAGVDGEAELGADAVGGGDEDRVGEARRLEVEERAEAAEARHDAWPRRCRRRRLDALDQGVAGVDVDARPRVGQPVRPVAHVSLRLARVVGGCSSPCGGAKGTRA